MFGKYEDLKNFKISCSGDLFLFFLPNYFMTTPLQFMLSENYFDLFIDFYQNIEKHFRDFISNENLISKIAHMFVYIFQYVYKFKKTSIETCYCCLGYDIGCFDDDDDETQNKIFERVKVINGYLRAIEQKLWNNKQFLSLEFK
jgi:hypothetical protein